MLASRFEVMGLRILKGKRYSRPGWTEKQLLLMQVGFN
jgi:hypothetical protein